MKIRTGFVSNSSSSSYVVAFKGKRPGGKTLLKTLGIEEESIAAKFFEPLLRRVFEEGEPWTLEQMLEDYAATSEKELLASAGKETQRMVQLLKKGWTITAVSVDYDDAGMNAVFAEEIDTPTFKTFQRY